MKHREQPATTKDDIQFSSDAARAAKRERVLAFLRKHELDGMLLTLQGNFAWYTGGGRGYVNIATERSIADLLITSSGDHLFSNSIENIRLVSEELPWSIDHVHVHDWWEEGGSLATIRAEFGDRIESDAGPLHREFVRLRYALLPDEVDRYRALGRDTAEAFRNLLPALRQGITERDVAAELAGHLIRKGIAPLVMLVAFDERMKSYRHPLPTENKLGRLALVSVCGRRSGLVASLSRAFSLGSVPEELLRRHRAAAGIDSWLIAETVPGRRVSELFERLKGQYERAGYPGEWQLHHQGGATGYATREYRATGTCEEVVLDNQAFAWNPTITGAKSEDTILVKDGGNEILTNDPRWPVLDLEVGKQWIPRPDIFVLD